VVTDARAAGDLRERARAIRLVAKTLWRVNQGPELGRGPSENLDPLPAARQQRAAGVDPWGRRMGNQHRHQQRQRGEHCYPRTARRSPDCTRALSATASSLTVPACGARTTVSIFIASSVSSGAPASTFAPVATWT